MPAAIRSRNVKGMERIAPRTPAILCIANHQFAFPRMGTILMKHRVGWSQAALMVIGFILGTGFALWVIACAIRYAANPTWEEAGFRAKYQPFQWALRYGLALCAISWVWALFSSAGIW